MPNSAKHSPFILFFDCYIVSSNLGMDEAYRTPDPRLGEIYRQIRSTDTVYRHVSKLDIVKYTLLSYLGVPWDDMIIRVECEDEEDREEFFAFARRHFPFAKIVNQRSATAEQYYEALVPLKRHGNPWVFYSPNNDHPLVGDPLAFGPLLELAEEIEPVYPGYFVAIAFTHFTETQMMQSPDQFNWLYNSNITAVIGETRHATIVRQEKFACDSIVIYRLEALLKMFEQSTNSGRCIRLEDTGHLMTRRFRQILVLPKMELCRHFDGYMHVDLPTPPLFIPYGFFESNIRIRYGFANREPGCVNVNPYEEFSYLGGAADVRSMLSELPVFWRDRIASIEIDHGMHARYASRRDDTFQFGWLKNPHADSFVLTNYKRSAWRVTGQPISLFNADLCTVEHMMLPKGGIRRDSTTQDSSAVYFVLHGSVVVGSRRFQKDDLVIFQGECAFDLQAEIDTSIVKVGMAIGSQSPAARVFNWRDVNP